MKKILLLSSFILIFTGVSLAQQEDPADSARFKETLLLNKWWTSNPKMNNGRNGLKQYYRNLGKFRTIGTSTGAWGWKDKKNGILFIDYVGQKWNQKIIKLTANEFVYERDGKTYYLKSGG